MVDGIVESFSGLSDPRRSERIQHKLIDILVYGLYRSKSSRVSFAGVTTTCCVGISFFHG
jgi:hypothetical protein